MNRYIRAVALRYADPARTDLKVIVLTIHDSGKNMSGVRGCCPWLGSSVTPAFAGISVPVLGDCLIRTFTLLRYHRLCSSLRGRVALTATTPYRRKSGLSRSQSPRYPDAVLPIIFLL